jgi:hypothetical protein
MMENTVSLPVSAPVLLGAYRCQQSIKLVIIQML